MAEGAVDKPIVYFLHGEDEFGITRFIQRLRAQMGDTAMAELNTTQLDGKQFTLGELRNAVLAIPFLIERRLVILDQPLERLKSEAQRQDFCKLLERIPPQTALVITEYRTLKKHWLLNWARKAGKRAYVRAFPLPKGGEAVQWIRKEAKARGGAFTPQAAALLASLVPDDPRALAQEIEKLLAYVNYHRPVEADDVDYLTAAVRQGDVFKMVDAIGQRNGRIALEMLHHLLEEREPLSLFGMIVRQFRLLLLASELLEEGATRDTIAKALRLYPFVADKIIRQTRNFSLPLLEAIYQRLLEVDERIKTGKVSAETALDTLIVGLTTVR